MSNLGDPSIKTIADVLALVKTAVAARQPGDAIRGGGWDEGKFKENRYLLASDLDTVAPNNPVWLTQTTGHYGVANSLAMKRAGITKDTKDPPAGTIDRDKDGNPTGVFKEAAMGLVNRGLGGGGGGRGNGQGPDAGVRRIIAGFNREGMTAVKEPQHQHRQVGSLPATAGRRLAHRARLRAVGRRPHGRIREAGHRQHGALAQSAGLTR